MPASKANGGMCITLPLLFRAEWPKVAPTVIDPAKSTTLNRASANRWIFGKTSSKHIRRPISNVLSVDERQFEMRYAPIACGLQFFVVGCALMSVIAALWYFLFR